VEKISVAKLIDGTRIRPLPAVSASVTVGHAIALPNNAKKLIEI